MLGTFHITQTWLCTFVVVASLFSISYFEEVEFHSFIIPMNVWKLLGKSTWNWMFVCKIPVRSFTTVRSISLNLRDYSKDSVLIQSTKNIVLLLGADEILRICWYSLNWLRMFRSFVSVKEVKISKRTVQMIFTEHRYHEFQIVHVHIVIQNQSKPSFYENHTRLF